MPLHLNYQFTAALVALALLVLAIFYVLFSDVTHKPPGRALYDKGDELVNLRASFPNIGPFESFNVNDENPFLPKNIRDDQTRLIKGQPPITEVRPIIPVSRPKLVLPKLEIDTDRAPNTVGYVGTEEHTVVFVRDGNSDIPVPLHGTWHGWVLSAVENSKTVIWIDPSGVAHSFLIGRGLLTNTQKVADEKTPTDKAQAADALSTHADQALHPESPPHTNKNQKKNSDDGHAPSKKTPADRPKKRGRTPEPPEPSAPDRL